MMDVATAPGRREQKKTATRQRIKLAALRLAGEDGVDHLTVARISEAADIATRTFFNYFDCKEDALVGETGAMSAELREAILGRPAQEAPLDTLRYAIGRSDLLREAHLHREQALARQRLVRDHPGLLARQLRQYAALERMFAETMAERLRVHPDRDLRPALLAALAVSVIRLAMHRWVADDSGRPDELVDELFALLQHELPPGPSSGTTPTG